MSVLDFLTSVFDKVITFFSDMWYSATFILSTAYNAIFNYWSRLQYYLGAFADRYVTSTDWYHNFARPLLDVVGVFNYDKTKYSAVDTFPSNVEYNTQLKGPLRTFVYTLSDRVTSFFAGAYDKVMFVVSYPSQVIDYAFNAGAQVVRTYEQFERATVRFLKGEQPTLETYTNDGFFAHMLHLGETIFYPVAEVFGPSYDKLQSLLQSAIKVVTLTDEKIFPKITEVFTSEYSGLAGLLDVATNVIDIMTPTKKTKLDYLLDKAFSVIVSTTEQPDQTFLGAIRDVFLGWFGNLLSEWLLSPAEKL